MDEMDKIANEMPHYKGSLPMIKNFKAYTHER